MNRSFERTNFFDDGIFQSKRVVQVMRGCGRRMGLRRFDDAGDWETLCRAVTLLLRYYSSKGEQLCLRDSIVYACDMCASLSPFDGIYAAMSRNSGIIDLYDCVDIPSLVAWCAVCFVKGGDNYHMKLPYADIPLAGVVVDTACRCFDNLSDVRYTDTDVFRLDTMQIK